MGERVREGLAALGLQTPEGEPLLVTASFGVASYPPTDSVEQLLRVADSALYRAKAAGRNKVLAYEPAYLGGSEPLEPVHGPGDPTPEPGALLSLAHITPANGVSVLTDQPSQDVLVAALTRDSGAAGEDEAASRPATAANGEPLLIVEDDEMARRANHSGGR
jgi:hypothetical protein